MNAPSKYIYCEEIDREHALILYHRWGQIAILTALADYKPSGGKEAEGICDRVLPRLQHANGAVVLAAIKVHWNRDTVRYMSLKMNGMVGFAFEYAVYQRPKLDQDFLPQDGPTSWYVMEK